MDRRLLFPAVVVTAWAQQASQQALPANAEAEKALRARAEQFYQLEVGAKFRQAEAFVAEDTKDYYYNNDKPEMKNFQIDRVEFTDATHAKLTVTVTKTMRAPNLGSMDFRVPISQDWKVENSEWVWYFVPTDVIDTPFGKWHVTSANGAAPAMPAGIPDVSSLDKMILIDRTSVELESGSQKVETVTISNQLPGAVDIQIGTNYPDFPKGLVVETDKKRLARGEKAVISFHASGDAKPSGTVRIAAQPLREFLIQVRTK